MFQVTMTDTWSEVSWGPNGMSYPKIDLSLDKFVILGGKVTQKKSLGMWDAGMPGALMFKAGMDLKNHQVRSKLS